MRERHLRTHLVATANAPAGHRAGPPAQHKQGTVGTASELVQRETIVAILENGTSRSNCDNLVQAASSASSVARLERNDLRANSAVAPVVNQSQCFFSPFKLVLVQTTFRLLNSYFAFEPSKLHSVEHGIHVALPWLQIQHLLQL